MNMIFIATMMLTRFSASYYTACCQCARSLHFGALCQHAEMKAPYNIVK